MPRLIGRALAGFLLVVSVGSAQTTLTWEQVRERFRVNNPNLTAGRVGIEQSKAQEITAYLRPNPDVTATLDQLNPFSPNPYQPLANTLPLVSGSYLHEREHKRELRRDSAQGLLAIADRRAAIVKAIGLARPGDLVLLAGKGHEQYQVIGNEQLPFDDAAVAREALARRRTNSGVL